MVEPAKTGSEKPEIDLNKYVPKEEFEKTQKTLQESEAKLKHELDQAKMSLLDPEYISYLEKRKADAFKKSDVKLPDDKDLENLSQKELLKIAVNKATELVKGEVDTRFRRNEQALQDVLALLELQSVEKRYDDFDDYRERTVELLEDSKSNLTIEQAYKLAKAEARDADPDGEAAKKKSKDKKSPESEKPSGSRPAESFKPKDFKGDKAAASLDAWDQIVGAGKETL